MFIRPATLPPVSHPATHWAAVRKVSVVNSNDYAIPAFACMQISEQSTAIKNRHPSFYVIKPNALGVQYQKPSGFLFNGPTVIPARTYGIGTQDWPALALCSGDITGFFGQAYSNFTAGPVAGSWALEIGRRLFSIVIADGSDLTGGAALTPRCYVAPNVTPPGHFFGYAGNSPVAYTAFGPSVQVNITAGTSITQSDNYAVVSGRVQVAAGGLYNVAWSCKGSYSVDDQDLLYSILINNANPSGSPDLITGRTNTGGSAGAMALCVPVELEADDFVSVAFSGPGSSGDFTTNHGLLHIWQ